MQAEDLRDETFSVRGEVEQLRAQVKSLERNRAETLKHIEDLKFDL